MITRGERVSGVFVCPQYIEVLIRWDGVRGWSRMGFQFAEVATEIETARLLTYNAARLKVSPLYHLDFL